MLYLWSSVKHSKTRYPCNTDIWKVNTVGIKWLKCSFQYCKDCLTFLLKIWKKEKLLWNVFVLIVENLNTLNLPNELMLCHHQEEGAGEDLDRVYDPMTYFVRENRTQADHHLCMWMTLLQLKVKKLSLKMEYPHQNDHSKYHRRFLLVVDFQAIEEDGVLFTVKTGFSHHLLQKVTMYVF